MSLAATTSRTAELLLLRLLTAGKRPPSPSRVRADLARFVARPLRAEHWQDLVSELVDADLLAARPLRLTDAGRARALGLLGLERLPPRANWKTIRSRYLVPLALGLSPDDSRTRDRISNEPGLGAHLLKERFDLPATAQTLSQALEALICRELGFETEGRLADVRRIVLSRLLEVEERLSWEEIEKQLPRHVVGARKAGVEGLREAILRRWTEGIERADGTGTEPASASEKSAAFDLPTFAATVRAVARECRTGRFGDNKVYISHVWRKFREEPGCPPLELEEFKRRLTEANTAGLLHLSRADLVEAMDSADVRESETPYLHTVFHFVLLEREHP